MLKVNFVTTNHHKFDVARHFFEAAGLSAKVDLRQHALETPEIQADTVEEVALSSARWAGKQLGEPVVVADTGLSIAALKGFPGPYMKYLNDTLEPENLLDMLRRRTDRTAEFVGALAYYDPGTEMGRVFRSVTPGQIAKEAASVPGSTVDRLFIPDGHQITVAAMPEEERVAVWSTGRWQQLTDFLLAQEL
jgi:XTP/dITP diphosphohydrolase